jgi:hypothetical protein
MAQNYSFLGTNFRDVLFKVFVELSAFFSLSSQKCIFVPSVSHDFNLLAFIFPSFNAFDGIE